MAIKPQSLQVGDTVYDCHNERMGNTTMRAMAVRRVEIVSIESNNYGIRWNNNDPVRYVGPRYFEQSRIRRHPPEWVYRPLEGRICVLCHRREQEGHAWNCQHPKAKRGK